MRWRNIGLWALLFLVVFLLLRFAMHNTTLNKGLNKQPQRETGTDTAGNSSPISDTVVPAEYRTDSLHGSM
jgi:hypothetical protein